MNEVGRKYTDLAALAAPAPLSFFEHALELEGGVCVALDLVLVLCFDILQLEVRAVAMAARYIVVFVLFRFSGLKSNAKTTNVVFTASCEHHIVEVAEADRAVVLEVSSLLLFVRSEPHRIPIQELNILFVDLGVNSYLNSVLQLFFLVLRLDLLKYSQLLEVNVVWLNVVDVYYVRGCWLIH